MFSLNHKNALITGATGHLGHVMSMALAEAGAHVFLCARNKEKLEKLAVSIAQNGGKATVIEADLSELTAADNVINLLRKKINALDVLVNNAYWGTAATIETAEMSSFQSADLLSVQVPFRLVQQAMDLLIQPSSGSSVINIASMYASVSPDPRLYGESGQNNPPYYGAAKAGMLQLTRYLACHLASKNIRVNAISPGPFPNPSVQGSHPEFAKHLSEKVPLARLGEPKELIGPLLFLASEASSYVTGINLPVDGGWTAW
ncbi:MAG: SDR family oxidoreductase [Cyanobacteria bacterium]|nr:SDR family oxidoreductase [Cyanobacteriota bacterium]